MVLEQGSLAEDEKCERFERWAKAGKAGGAKLVMQISHPGRQVYASMGTQAVSASETKVTLEGPGSEFSELFASSRLLMVKCLPILLLSQEHYPPKTVAIVWIVPSL